MKRMQFIGPVLIGAAVAAAPPRVFAGGDTLVVHANGPTIDKIINGDTLSNGQRAHHVYQLVSLDTTYLFDATITANSDFALIGVPDPMTRRPPCIQPDVLQDNSVPAILVTLNGRGTKGIFRNLYLLGTSISNTFNYGEGEAIRVGADSIRVEVDNVIFEQWGQFAIDYVGNWDNFFITNCKFRNLTNLPTAWYVGELLRNRNDAGLFKTDSIIIRYNTLLCVNAYATAATGGIVNYYDFSHNNVIYTFKNPFFLDRMVNARFNNNIFYGAYAGGQSMAEFSQGWDTFIAGTPASIITMGPLDSTTAALLLGHASAGDGDPAAEAMRHVEVLNNVYIQPTDLTTFWRSWNNAHGADSAVDPVWMDQRTVNMFADNTSWPGFIESGTQFVDPGFGGSIPGVLYPEAGNRNGVGLLSYFAAVRGGTGTNEMYGYNFTQVGTALDWTPPWPLPESADMAYTMTALKTGATDGRPIGDPNWFGITSVKNEENRLPETFALLQNFPNPFNPSTEIGYRVEGIGYGVWVTLKVYDILGREVGTLVNDRKAPGTYEVMFDGRGLSSGVYIYRMTAGKLVDTRKMILLK